jgi:hypothetical protein
MTIVASAKTPSLTRCPERVSGFILLRTGSPNCEGCESGLHCYCPEAIGLASVRFLRRISGWHSQHPASADTAADGSNG